MKTRTENTVNDERYFIELTPREAVSLKNVLAHHYLSTRSTKNDDREVLELLRRMAGDCEDFDVLYKYEIVKPLYYDNK